MKAPQYPFVPKSALSLWPGQYWSVPLKGGRFACGRVIQGAANYAGASRMFFLGALLDWIGTELPTSSKIAGAKVLAEGKVHIKSIERLGGVILGARPLSEDNIEPQYYKFGLGDPPNYLLHGIQPVRPLSQSDARLPILGVWGYGYIRSLAEQRLLPPNEA